MPIAETIVTTAKLLIPILSAIYNSAKGPIQSEFQQWNTANQAKRIARTLTKIENVKTLWSPDKEVSLHSFYFPSKIIDSDFLYDEEMDFEHEMYKQVTFLSDLPDGNLTIQGIVGQGKSIFLRYLASQSIKSEQVQIPIFIELRTLTSKLSLRQAIYRVLESVGVGISEESFDHLANTGHLILLLDAFDELQEELVIDVLNELEFLSAKYSTFRIIVTSRPGNEIQKVNNFRTVRLGPLERQEFPSFLQKLKLNAVKRTDLLSAIDENSSKISEIIRTPLMLTLVVIVYESEREIPPTLSDFFERLFQVVFTRHDRLKAGFNRKHHCGLSERKLQLLFEAFCFMTMQSSYGRTLTSKQFVAGFDRALKFMPEYNCEVEKFRLDITKIACLMLEEGLDLTTFLHKSIMEYYAAAFIAHSTDEVAQLFYFRAPKNYKQWESVITFLRDIDPYRFAKHYTLKDAPLIVSHLQALQAEQSTPKLLSFIEEHQPGIGVAIRSDYHKPTKSSFPIRAYGPMTPPSGLALVEFPNMIIRAMDSILPRTMMPNELQSILEAVPNGDSLTGAENEILIPHHVLIEHFGPSEFWSALGILEQKINTSIVHANGIVDSQERRKLIFEID